MTIAGLIAELRGPSASCWYNCTVRERTAEALEKQADHIQLHAGDCLSLDNEVRLMRQHWLDECEHSKRLSTDLAAAKESTGLNNAMLKETLTQLAVAKGALERIAAMQPGKPSMNIGNDTMYGIRLREWQAGNVARAALQPKVETT